MRYELMNKDTPLLEFETTNGRAAQTKTYTDKRPHGWNGIENWIRDRNRIPDKSQFTGLVKTRHLNGMEAFLDTAMALGLNDTLWVRPAGSDLTWSGVNFYSNGFDDVSKPCILEPGRVPDMPVSSPEFTSEGSFRKFWSRNTGGVVTIHKTGSEGFSNAGLEPYSEYLASAAARQISRDVTEYGLEIMNGKPFTSCGLFTDEDTGLVPAYKILSGGSCLDVWNQCDRLGFGRECAAMFVVDAVTMNQDRHMGNFGFLQDNDTFEIKAFAPLFDFNLSMLCYAAPEDLMSYKRLNAYIRKNNIGPGLSGSWYKTAAVLLETYGMEIDLPRKIKLPRQMARHPKDQRTEHLEKILNRNLEAVKARTRPTYYA